MSRSATNKAPYTLEAAEEDIANAANQHVINTEAFTQNDNSVVPNTPTQGYLQYSASGQKKYISADGNAYNTGCCFSIYQGGGQTISSTSSAVLGSMSFPLAVGAYRLSGKISGTNNVANSNQAVRMIATGGLVASFCDVTGVSFNTATIQANLGVYQITTTLNSDITSGTMTNGFTWYWWIDGMIVVSTAGTLNVEGRCVTSGADTWTLNAPSYFLVQPVS